MLARRALFVFVVCLYLLSLCGVFLGVRGAVPSSANRTCALVILFSNMWREGQEQTDRELDGQTDSVNKKKRTEFVCPSRSVVNPSAVVCPSSTRPLSLARYSARRPDRFSQKEQNSPVRRQPVRRFFLPAKSKIEESISIFFADFFPPNRGMIDRRRQRRRRSAVGNTNTTTNTTRLERELNKIIRTIRTD